jgi:hypothetical protein
VRTVLDFVGGPLVLVGAIAGAYLSGVAAFLLGSDLGPEVTAGPGAVVGIAVATILTGRREDRKP